MAVGCWLGVVGNEFWVVGLSAEES